jgi:hypothetical protein
MEGKSVDRQLGLTLTLPGDLHFRNTTAVPFPKISPKKHTDSNVQDGHSIPIRNFCNYLRNYKIPTPNIALQIFKPRK